MNNKLKTFSILFFIISYICINLIYLDKYPVPGQDAIWYLGPPNLFIKEGSFRLAGVPVDWGVTDFCLMGRAFNFVQVLFIKMFSLTPWVTSLPPFIGGLLSLLMCFLLTKKIYNTKIATMSTFFLGMSSLFIVLSHSQTKPETMCLFLLFAELYLFIIVINSQNIYLAFVAGLISTLGLSFRHTAMTFPVILLVLMCIYRKRLNIKLAISVFTGMTAGIGIWFILQYPIDVVEFFRLTEMIYKGRTIFEVGILEAIRLEFSRYYFYFWKIGYHRNIFLLIVFIICTIIYFIKKDSNKWIILVPIMMPPLVYASVISTQSTHPTLYMLPFLMIITSVVIEELLHFSKPIIVTTGKIILCSLCLFFLIENISILYLFGNVNFSKFAKQLKEHVPKNSNVLGSQEYWIMLPDTNYLSMEFMPHKGKPDILSRVIKNNIEFIIVRELYSSKKIERFVKKYCNLSVEINDKVFGGPYELALRGGKIFYRTSVYKVDPEKLKQNNHKDRG